MTAALDTLFFTGPVFEQLDPKDILVTPTGKPQTTLADALGGASGGTVDEVVVQAGPFLANNTITVVGTVQNSSASLTAHGVLIAQGSSPVSASAVLTSGQLLVGQTGADPLPKTVSGDATLDNTGALGLVATGVTAGTYGDATHVGQFQVDAAGRLLAAAKVTITGAAPTGAAGGDLGGTYPNPTVLSVADITTGTLAVAHGGLGLSAGTSGGVLGFTASGVLASSVALTASALVLGGGPGATPTALGSLGTTTTLLHGNAAGAPTFAAVSLSADVTGLLPFANFATLAATSLFGNGAITGGTGGNITVGPGLALSVGGTLTASGSGGSVTSVIAQGGPFLANVTITAAGTINNSTASLTPHGVLLGEGTGAAVATAAGTDGQLLIATSAADPAFTAMSGDTTITKAGVATVARINGGTLGVTTPTTGNLLIANGSSWVSVAMSGDAAIASTGSITVSKIGGVTPATVANFGAVLNSGTVQVNNVATLTGTASGTLTLAATTGTSDIVINMPASGGAVTLAAAPTFKRQRYEIDIVQGATAGTVVLNSGFVFGTSGGPTSFTVTPTAAAVDRLMLISPDGTKLAVLAIAQGFTL